MPEITIVAHNGNFHADDVFAVASLRILLEKKYPGVQLKIIRTRDQAIIDSGDYVVDVGGVQDENTNRFDHHQKGGAGARDNGIPFASFGLVWKKFGEEICGSKDVADIIEHKLVMPIDGVDNGVDMYQPIYADVMPFTIHEYLYMFYPTWKEKSVNIDTVFASVVDVAKDFLVRMINRARDNNEARVLVEQAYQQTHVKEILVFDTEYPSEALDALYKYPEPLYVIRPDEQGNNTWKVNAVRRSSTSFELRKSFPSSWAGKRDSEFEKASGVPGAIFCHNKLFLVVAQTKEAAIKLAQIALANNS